MSGSKMLQCLLLSTACNAIRILSSHHVFPGRLGVYHRVGELIPRQDALDLERRALALPLGAWETDRHVSFPTRDVPVEVVCDDFDDLPLWLTRVALDMITMLAGEDSHERIRRGEPLEALANKADQNLYDLGMSFSTNVAEGSHPMFVCRV